MPPAEASTVRLRAVLDEQEPRVPPPRVEGSEVEGVAVQVGGDDRPDAGAQGGSRRPVKGPRPRWLTSMTPRSSPTERAAPAGEAGVVGRPRAPRRRCSRPSATKAMPERVTAVADPDVPDGAQLLAEGLLERRDRRAENPTAARASTRSTAPRTAAASAVPSRVGAAKRDHHVLCPAKDGH